MTNPGLQEAVSKELAKRKHWIESMVGDTAVLVEIREQNRGWLNLFPPLYVYRRLRGPKRLVLTVDEHGRIWKKDR